MVSPLDFFSFLTDASGLELVFLMSAIIGSTLFFIWFLLTMIGGVAGDVLEGVFEIDIGDSDLAFKALTFQGIMAFFMMFGLVGYALMNSGQEETLAAIGGIVAGGISLYLVGKMFEGFRQLEMHGNVDIKNAIGATGSVYSRIPADGVGQVQVTFQGKLQTRAAVSADGNPYPTGDLIEVVGLRGGDTLEVKSVVSIRKQEEE